MTKTDLLARAHALGLDVTDNNTVAEIEAAITAASTDNCSCPVCGQPCARNHVHSPQPRETR